MAQRFATALAIVVCFGLTGCGSSVNKANYDKIADGMSLADVEGIMGKGTEQASSNVNVPGVAVGGLSVPGMGMSSKVVVWKDGSKTITVTFLNDKVMAKVQAGL